MLTIRIFLVYHKNIIEILTELFNHPWVVFMRVVSMKNNPWDDQEKKWKIQI